MFLSYLSPFPSLVRLLLSAVYFAAVSGLYPVIVCCHGSVSPSVSPVSPSDSGARIPPPAQRSELQSHPAAAGHWHPVRGHQTVSFTVPVCQQLPKRNPCVMFELEAAVINVCHCQILTCGSYGHLLQGFHFSHAVAQCHLTVADSLCHLSLSHNYGHSSAQPVSTKTDTGFDNRGNLSYYSTTVTQWRGLFWVQQDGTAKGNLVNEDCDSVLRASKNRRASVVFMQHESFDNDCFSQTRLGSLQQQQHQWFAH